jgi:hypothetical protein
MNDYQGVQVLVSKRGKGHLSNRRKAMAGLNDMIRSSAPGGRSVRRQRTDRQRERATDNGHE